MKKTIAIMASGGAASGMNTSLAKLTRIFSQLGYNVIGFQNGWKGLIEKKYTELTPEVVEGIDSQGGCIIGSCSRVNVWDYQGKNFSQQCYKNYSELNIVALVVLGGDGSTRQGRELINKFRDMNFICIPSTMDRDLNGSIETVGFYTAVQEASKDIVDMVKDGNTMGREIAIEVMGRDCSSVALYATLKALEQVKIDILLVREKPYCLDKIAKYMSASDRPISLVMAEGAENNSGQSTTGTHANLAGAAGKLVIDLKKERNFSTGREIKSTSAGYSQRSGPPVEMDKFFATAFAIKAAELILSGKKNKVVVCDEKGIIISKPIRHIAKANKIGASKQLDLSDPIFKLLEAKGVYFGD